MYNDDASVHWLLTINYTSRLFRWWISLTEFDFKVKYKKAKANTQADALRRLKNLTETITHDYKDDISVFLLDETNLKPELNRSPDEVGFLDVERNDIEQLYAKLDEP